MTLSPKTLSIATLALPALGVGAYLMANGEWFDKKKLTMQPQNNPRGLVSLTFDDGWKSVYDEAIPFLDQAGFPASLYITTSMWKDETNKNYMRPEQVQELWRKGYEVGSHGVLHEALSQISLDGAQREMTESKTDLESVGIMPSVFSYPLGDYSHQIAAAVKEAGYVGAVTTWQESNAKTEDPYILKREQVTNTTTIEEVKTWIDDAIRDDKWVILTFHEIGFNNREYEITPELFIEILKYVQETEVRVITVRDGIETYLEEK